MMNLWIRPLQTVGRNIRQYLRIQSCGDGADVLTYRHRQDDELLDGLGTMTGMDISPEMLEIAAGSGNSEIFYICQDMRGTGSSASCGCSSYRPVTASIILEPEDLIQVFVRVRENLKEDGVFCLT